MRTTSTSGTKLNDCTFRAQLHPHNQDKYPPYGRAEWDKLLGDYDAVTDVPGASFVDDLVAAYPDAKVVLTNRAVDGWIRSMNNTIWKNILRDTTNRATRHLDGTFMGPFYRLVYKIFTVNNGNTYEYEKCKKAYLEHCEHVRRVVPEGKLLEFSPPYAWEPLCAFLGDPVPEGEYPRINDTEAAAQIQAMWRRIGVINALRTVLSVVLPAAVAAGAILVYRVRLG